jgi:aryl-alcohol dehydrogenase-like predicted oxidoreductase
MDRWCARQVRYPASSNYAEVQGVADAGSPSAIASQPPVISQTMYNLLARGIEQEYLAMCGSSASRYGL